LEEKMDNLSDKSLIKDEQKWKDIGMLKTALMIEHKKELLNFFVKELDKFLNKNKFMADCYLASFTHGLNENEIYYMNSLLGFIVVYLQKFFRENNELEIDEIEFWNYYRNILHENLYQKVRLESALEGIDMNFHSALKLLWTSSKDAVLFESSTRDLFDVYKSGKLDDSIENTITMLLNIRIFINILKEHYYK
jgi:hypothetical protein